MRSLKGAFQWTDILNFNLKFNVLKGFFLNVLNI